MSLTRIAIRQFQSLRNVDLELGDFTVIVGPSNSGKSALIRAFKALASNVRGSGVITRGEKAMAITGYTEDAVVTLERSDRSGSYKLTNHDTTLTFNKLAGEVPEHITRALGISPVGEGGSVNFASQFDKPYLLDESGATVARVLGELTNVTTIFEAVRAANRVRANAASALKTRKIDLDQVKAKLASFTGLSDRVAALEEVEQLDTRRREVLALTGRLESALKTLHIAEREIEKAAVPDVPSGEPLENALHKYLDLQAALRGLAEKQKRLRTAEEDVRRLNGDVAHIEETLKDKLTEAGICPTCGQEFHA